MSTNENEKVNPSIVDLGSSISDLTLTEDEPTDTTNPLEVIRDNYMQTETETSTNALAKIKNDINDLMAQGSKESVQAYLREEMFDQLMELKQLYRTEFKDIPDTNPEKVIAREFLTDLMGYDSDDMSECGSDCECDCHNDVCLECESEESERLAKKDEEWKERLAKIEEDGGDDEEKKMDEENDEDLPTVHPRFEQTGGCGRIV